MLRVHSYESMGTFDGPGLRLVVFLQGCNFRCLYCANPDTIDLRGESKETSLEEIVSMAVSQKPFFGRRGGVTFSGGEPLLQAAALIPVVRALKAEGIHVCVDTNGSIWNDSVSELLGLVDLVLLDVKQFNAEAHRNLTAQSNERTIALAEWLEQNERPFWMRYVLVQGYSADEKDIRSLTNHFGGFKMIQRIEILPYHRLGVHKYEVMGLEYQLKDVVENTAEQLEQTANIFKESFDCVYVN